VNIALTIGFATTSATLLVTIILFAVDRLLTRRAEGTERRRQLVERVLDTFDRSTRALIRPAFVQVWTNAEVEYTLLLPRLLLEVAPKDRVIARWMHRQVQHMQLAVTRTEKVLRRARVAEALTQWHLGEVDNKWFEEQLKSDPLDPVFRVPRRTMARRLARDGWAWVQLFALLAAIAAMLRQAFGLTAGDSRGEK
jgi:hypothetical protein